MKNLKRKEGKFTKADGIINSMLSLVAPIVLIWLWEILSIKGVINPSIMPAPSRIFYTFKSMVANGELSKHLTVSVIRVAQGFIIGSILGIILGILMGLFDKINRICLLLVGILRPIPIIAWVPMLILWMGIDDASKITVIAIGSFWPVLINTINGIKSTDEKYLEVSYILEKSKIETLIKVVIPAALPSIFTGLRIGIGAAWMSVVGAEMIAAATGIGYLIMFARELSQPDVMLVGVFSIGVIGLVIDLSIVKIQSKLLGWNRG